MLQVLLTEKVGDGSGGQSTAGSQMVRSQSQCPKARSRITQELHWFGPSWLSGDWNEGSPSSILKRIHTGYCITFYLTLLCRPLVGREGPRNSLLLPGRQSAPIVVLSYRYSTSLSLSNGGAVYSVRRLGRRRYRLGSCYTNTSRIPTPEIVFSSLAVLVPLPSAVLSTTYTWPEGGSWPAEAKLAPGMASTLY